jgi:hypothetical protein
MLSPSPSRIALGFALALTSPGFMVEPATAQEELPAGLARVEIERSRQCVNVLARIQALETELEPLAMRSERMMALANAIALEDRSSAAPYDTTDPVEADVVAWFDRDQALATRYVESRDEALVAERNAARQNVKDRVTGVLIDLQTQADARIAAAGELTTTVGGCDGAILVRPAVLEVCDSTPSPVCEPARNPTPESPYRFVDQAVDLWQVEEVRPWTTPSPLGVTPDGQMGGARTVGYARTGNLTLSLAFAPLLGSKTDFTPEQLDFFQTVNDSVGFAFEHPDIAFAPALSMRATVPEPLAGETLYVLHFDEPQDADVLWTGPAGTGAAPQTTIPLDPRQLSRLASGHPIRFTAVIQEAEDGSGDVAYSIQFTPLNQARATSTLMSYFARQLSADLARLAPARE